MERMGASEDTNMLEQDAWLLLPHCVEFFFLSVQKERVIPDLLLPSSFAFFKNTHFAFVNLGQGDIEKETDVPSR